MRRTIAVSALASGALTLAVEKAAPFDVGVFEIDRVSLSIAADEVAELMSKLRQCIDADHWPGRYSEIQALQLPAWVYASDDDEDDDGFGLAIKE